VSCSICYPAIASTGSGSQAEGAIAGKGSVQRIKIHGKALEGNLEANRPIVM
jgi:hypothetical protein